MLDSDISGAPVVDEGGHLVGVLTDKDLIWKVGGRGVGVSGPQGGAAAGCWHEAVPGARAVGLRPPKLRPWALSPPPPRARGPPRTTSSHPPPRGVPGLHAPRAPPPPQLTPSPPPTSTPTPPQGAGAPEDHFIIPPVFLGFMEATVWLRDNAAFEEEAHKILAKTVGGGFGWGF
jgi:hypothetical protein